MIQPQIDFCCFRLVTINIALTHCYKLVSFLNLMLYSKALSRTVSYITDVDTGCPMKCSCAHQDVGTTVDCSALHLTSVPDRLPENTVVLYLRDNNIKSLTNQDLANCTWLQVVDLVQNGMNNIASNAFLSTKNLQKLFLSDNNISTFSLPVGIFDKLDNLKLLHLHNNVWRNAQNYSDFVFAQLTRLEHLSIDGIPGVNFTSGFSQLTHLTDLSIYGGLDIITNDTFAVFSKCKSLTSLKIQTKSLYNVKPMSFAYFPSLKTLDLSYNTGLGLRNISRAWWGLQFTNISKLLLTRLTAHGVGSASLSSEFFKYLNRTKITVLMLDKNNIVDMEPKLSESLHYLEHIDLSYNRISNAASLILDVWELRHLRYLDFSHQTKRYVEHRGKRSAEPSLSASHFSDIIKPRNNESSANTMEFFETCKTPPLPPCTNIKSYASKSPLPDYGSWCLPASPKIEVVKLSESLNVNYKNMPSIIILGGAHLKLLEYRLNGLEKLRGPLIVSQPMTNVVFDFSDNRFSCIAPDAFSTAVMLGSIFNELVLSGNKLAAQMEADINGITFKDFIHLKKLNLANNGIKSLPTRIFSKLPNTKVLNLSRNSLRQIEFQFNHMKMLQVCDISYNLITTLESSTLQKFSTLMETSNLSISLLGNPIQCSCETYYFLEWISKHQKQLMNFVDYSCLYKGKVVRFSNLTDVILVDLNFECSKQIAVIVSATLLGLVLILLSIVVCCYRYRWELRYFCLKLAQRSRQYQLLNDDVTCTYDAFVVYSNEDSDWVLEELIPHFEDCTDYHQPLRLCVHERDFLPGEYIIGNIWSRMEDSRKVILVISKNFTRSNYCNYEIELARMLSVEKARNLLVPVMLENVRMEDMSDSLRWIVRKLTYIEWPQWQPDREEFWQKLRETVSPMEFAHLSLSE